MHFRSFLLNGLIVGAILVFPTDVFAEKSEQEKKPSTQKAHAMEVVKTVKEQKSASIPSPQVKPENQFSEQGDKKVEKAIPAQTKDNVEGSVQLPNQASKKAQQTVQEVKQDSGKVSKVMQSNVNETKKTVKNSLPGKNQEAETKKARQQKTSPSNNVIHSYETEESSNKSVQHNISRENASQQSTKMVQMIDDEKSVQAIKEASSINEEPELEKKKEIPSSQGKYPRDIIVVQAQPNTKVPDGSSKDRTRYGQNTSSFVDNWVLEAEKYLNLKWIHPLVSRTLEYRNQWDNAPPSPPPQVTPFF